MIATMLRLRPHQIRCDVCEGHGEYVRDDESGVQRIDCDDCRGYGLVECDAAKNACECCASCDSCSSYNVRQDEDRVVCRDCGQTNDEPLRLVELTYIEASR